ncbi:hypothetical protein VTL71DRAFT_10692 [Oculimacula yallundae]|uniref:F-box domain-containing protein n=1 Tax=Oculimacula yallundae TaxID=86028 RepID=A0ABR4CTQ5_9HELO
MPSTTPEMQREPPTLLDVLGQYGIFDTLCRRLDTATLFSLRLVSRKLVDNYAAHAKERWNVNRRLKHFVKNPQGLRSLMAQSNALISGSFAVQFFDDVSWNESDLDIYVGHDGAAALGTFLCRKEGYRHEKKSAEDDDYDTIGFIQVDKYLRGDKDMGDVAKIQIISTRTIPARAILGCFSTTTVVNMMSWNAAYSMFPKMTFFEPRTQRKIAQGADIDAIQRQIDKYSLRGWDANGIPAVGSRRVGDCRSWKITLDVTGVESSSIPDFVIENCHFVVAGETYRGSNITSYRSMADEFTSHVLKYRYTDGYSLKNDFWEDHMRDRLQDLLLTELRKLDPEVQPDFLARPMQWSETDPMMHHALASFMIDFIKPETWTFYDELVPSWCEEWEKEHALRKLEVSMANVNIT